MTEGVAFILWTGYFYMGFLILLGCPWGWPLLIALGLANSLLHGGPAQWAGIWIPLGLSLLERSWVAFNHHSPHKAVALWPREAIALLISALSFGAFLGPALGAAVWGWLGGHSLRRFDSQRIFVHWSLAIALRLIALIGWTWWIVATMPAG